MKRVDRLADVLVLVPGDVRTAAVPQRQDCRDIPSGRIPAEVVPHEATQVLGQRHAELGGSLSRASMLLGVEGHLGALYHDGAILASTGEGEPVDLTMLR